MAKEEQKQQKTITVREFKMWLQGVEEMQEEGWTPSATQWKRIRDKIDQINIGVTETHQAVPVIPGFPTYRANNDGNARPPVVPAAPSAFDTAPPTASGLPVAMASVPGAKVKTPDIDTSNGNYKPPFV